MSDVKLGTATVLSGVVVLPRVGVWHANLVVQSDAAPTGAATLTLGGGAVVMVGTVTRGGEYAGVARVRMVGGAGGLATAVTAKKYVGAPASLMIGDALRAAGETLSTTADTATLATVFALWTRAAGKARDALTAVAQAANTAAVWRVLADGTVWIGPETWPDSGITSKSYTLVASMPEHGVDEVAMEVPLLKPGTLFRSRKVSAVEHRITAGSIRSSVWYENA